MLSEISGRTGRELREQQILSFGGLVRLAWHEPTSGESSREIDIFSLFFFCWMHTHTIESNQSADVSTCVILAEYLC
jgi:hypothetical protein